MQSMAEEIAVLPEAEKLLADLSDEEANELLYDWKFWARPKQLAPKGGWATWILRAGRGFGKTRSGAQWFHERAMQQRRWMALVARTPADARDFCIEGVGGILRNVPPNEKPHYEPSKRRLTWKNGTWATIYSDDEPDQLRGFSGDTAWLDEFGKYKNPEDVWDNLQFGMREASKDKPRRIITTTPKPIKILKTIEAMPDTVTVIGSSYENRSNLDADWFDKTLRPYEGTRLGRQEIHAEIIEDVEGALWNVGQIEKTRVERAPEMKRIVIAVDPAVTAKAESDETGIVVVGRGTDDHGYVLADLSMRASPNRWANEVVRAYYKHYADRVVAEVNNGGDLVSTVIRGVDANISYSDVRAKRGKYTRAEPVAALYEQFRIHHVGAFPQLEDQMTTWVPGDKSPDRIDALVWGFTELFLNNKGTLWVG